MVDTQSLPPLLILLGPTAIGKTDLAMHLAQTFNGEIIGADSRQIYKHMDIGTAKPTPEQLSAVPHHVVDFIAPDDTFTLADFKDSALSAIKDITARDKLPMLVGGTGQYLTCIEEGWSIPRVPPNPALREQLNAEADEIGVDAFHAKLEAVDPEAAAKIHPNNVRRVVRSLEVYLETGTPISILQRKKLLPYNIRTLGLKMERDPLYERADHRVDIMVELGFVKEVENLLNMGYDRNLRSMSALGYREMAAHLLDDTPLDEAIQLTKFSTHDFIRSQEVWFRGHDNGTIWHNIEGLDVKQVEQATTHWLEGTT
ncbi:MAG: tRNA (adenosine(37)-N6)-dimethylallyltransferase MiaA [Chloroflexota bacterium]